MDKQKQIEEMARIIAFDLCPNRSVHARWGEEAQCYSDNNFAECTKIKNVVDKLYNAGYRKIPENAVVLTREEYDGKEIVVEMSGGHKLRLAVSKFGEMSKILEEQTRKETAEKFIERQKELEEALLDMVVQFCQMGEYGKLQHIFMSAEEQAFDVLDINYGEKVDDVYERFNKKWNRPIDEICKEMVEGK